MSWWAVALLVAVAALVAWFVGWLIGRKRSTPPNAQELIKQERLAAQKTLDAERKRSTKLKQIAEELRQEKEKVNAWFQKHQLEIKAAAEQEFMRLSSDSAAVDAELDRLLGREDPTPEA